MVLLGMVNGWPLSRAEEAEAAHPAAVEEAAAATASNTVGV
jgi:hypothetical protein